jgi:hypothetical protein
MQSNPAEIYLRPDRPLIMSFYSHTLSWERNS